jgi:hypothetical protein
MADLSPAAQAIRAAFNDRYELCGPFDDNWQELCLAAALRAASTTLTNARAADALRANAAELEGGTGSSSTL